MDHKELMRRVIAREKTSRIPVAFWRHFPVDDQTPDALTRSTIAFQKMFDLDFIKVSPSSSFCLKDWGARDVWKGDSEGTRDYLEPVIQRPQDWAELPILDVRRGALGAQLECLRQIKKNVPADTPIIQTVFSPLSQAKNLAGKSQIVNQLRQFPELVEKGLETITETTRRFIEECRKIGLDGVFYAVQHASYDILSRPEYLRFGHSFDAKIFEALTPFWLNVLHIHGQNIMFDLLRDSPFQVFNWHDRETSPSLREGKGLVNGAVCGGLSRIGTMVLGSREKIRLEFEDAIRQTNQTGFVLGTGCVCPVITPLGNIFDAINLARGH